MNEDTPNAYPSQPTYRELCVIGTAFGVSADHAQVAWQAAMARLNAEALERAFTERENRAFDAWWETQPITLDREVARVAWLARALQHRDYEARVEADTAERMNNTSAEMDRVTQQRDRARVEVERLQGVVNNQDSRLAELLDELRRTKAIVRRLDHHLQSERWESKQLKARVEELEQGKRIDLPPLTIGIDVQADGVHAFVPTDDDHADPEPFLRALRAEAAADQAAATVADPAPAAHPPPTQAEIAGTFAVLREVGAERVRQHAKWGRQEHPLGRRGEALVLAEAAGFESNLEVMGQRSAKARCNTAFRNGFGTYSHILLEEVSEAIDAPSIADMRTELIQVAAVAVQMVEAIDRRAAEAADV